MKATDSAAAIPAKMQWYKLLMYYIGSDTRTISKQLDTNGIYILETTKRHTQP